MRDYLNSSETDQTTADRQQEINNFDPVVMSHACELVLQRESNMSPIEVICTELDCSDRFVLSRGLGLSREPC